MGEKYIDKKAVIIFGGSGFIGTHLSQYLLRNNFVKKIYCVDIVKPRYNLSPIEYIYYDVRNPIDIEIDDVETIYNLAAIHQTPGHPNEEYFVTNILGAQNVCAFAEKRGIDAIVFTSSISPYGPLEKLKKEDDIPQPTTAYGISKLIAEYIHRCWFAKSPNRKLVIVRPGAVFGYGEGGNFTRLYRSMRKRYFFYPGRKDTKKACIYVKDFVRVLYEMSKNNERFQMYNMCYPESPSIESIVKTISNVTGVADNSLVIPGNLLKSGAGVLSFIFRLMGKENGIHPDRVKKLMFSTNISGEKLAKSPYALKYSLKEAIEDWYRDCDKNGLF